MGNERMMDAGELLFNRMFGGKASSEEDQRKRLDEWCIPLYKTVRKYFLGNQLGVILGGGVRPSMAEELGSAVIIIGILNYIETGNEEALVMLKAFVGLENAESSTAEAGA